MTDLLPAGLIARAKKYHVPVVWRPAPGTRIGTAVFVTMTKVHSKEWHSRRAEGYGGSDVAAIVGCSKWSSRTSLWSERVGRVPRMDDGKNAAQKRWGQRLEHVVIEEFAERHPELVVVIWPLGLSASFSHVDRPWQIAQPDGLWWNPATGEWGLIEAKTARYDDEWKDPDLGLTIVPVYYLTQVQWYLDTFGMLTYDVLALFTGSDYHEFHGNADPFEQTVNRDAVVAFDELVRTETPPELDGHERTLAIVRKEHPKITPKLEAELGSVGDELVAANRNVVAADERLNKAKSEALRVAETAQYLTLRGLKIAARQAKGEGDPFIVMKVK